MNDTITFAIFLGLFLLMAVIHEMAHAASALFFGDKTAQEEGRITLNPIKHIDPFGSLILPAALYFSTGFLFGSAKPVPINPTRFDKKWTINRAFAWVAFAGPLSNFILAFFFFWLNAQLRASIGPEYNHWDLRDVIMMAGFINILLGGFNMIPFPPLDGSKIVAGFLPTKAAYWVYRMDRYAWVFILGLFALIYFTPLGQNLFQYIRDLGVFMNDLVTPLVIK